MNGQQVLAFQLVWLELVVDDCSWLIVEACVAGCRQAMEIIRFGPLEQFAALAALALAPHLWVEHADFVNNPAIE